MKNCIVGTSISEDCYTFLSVEFWGGDDDDMDELASMIDPHPPQTFVPSRFQRLGQVNLVAYILSRMVPLACGLQIHYATPPRR